MKYALSIMICAAVFAVLGVVAAWGAAQQDTSGRDVAIPLFVALPLGGAVTGVLVGVLAAYVGRRFTDTPVRGTRAKGESS